MIKPRPAGWSDERREDKYPWQLSGGMQQRAQLCRALIHEPSLLMLDEPFGALDMFTREELWLALQDLWLARRPTVILVTHDLREAVFLADRVLVMSARPGRIILDRKIDLPRPRHLDKSYEPESVALVQEVREHIIAARARSQSPAGLRATGHDSRRNYDLPLYTQKSSLNAGGAPRTAWFVIISMFVLWSFSSGFSASRNLCCPRRL